VELLVTDDGRGFDRAAKGAESFGLDIMRERADDAGACLLVESEPGGGTRVGATWKASCRCEECS
jgi:signal transduction histidine kinase